MTWKDIMRRNNGKKPWEIFNMWYSPTLSFMSKNGNVWNFQPFLNTQIWEMFVIGGHDLMCWRGTPKSKSGFGGLEYGCWGEIWQAFGTPTFHQVEIRWKRHRLWDNGMSVCLSSNTNCCWLLSSVSNCVRRHLTEKPYHIARDVPEILFF